MKPAAPEAGPWLPPVRLTLAIFLVLLLAIGLIHVLLMLGFPFQIEYVEGPVLEYSTGLLHGEPLYSSIDKVPPRTCIFAPLHIWLATFFMGGQPVMFGGRLVASLSLLGVLGTLAAYLRVRAGSVASVCGVIFFLGHPLVLGWAAINRSDMLALSLTSAGMCLAARALEKSWRWPVDCVAALCFALSFLAKQSFVSGAVATVFITLWKRPKHGVVLGVGYAGLVLAEMGILNRFSHGEAYNVMFRLNAITAGVFVLDQMLLWLRHYLISVPGLLILVLVHWKRGGLRTDPLLSLFVVGSTFMAMGSGRVGGYYNYFLELHLGLSILGAIAIQDWLDGAPRRSTRLVIQCLALLQAMWAFASTLPPVLYSPYQYARFESLVTLQGRYPTYLDRRWSVALMQPWLDHYPGSILVENIGNVVALGHRPWICDPFYFYVMAKAGCWDEQKLVGAVERQEFSVIVLQKLEGNLRFSPRVMSAVADRYVKVGEASIDTIYLPRARGASPGSGRERSF